MIWTAHMETRELPSPQQDYVHTGISIKDLEICAFIEYLKICT
jgi:hypothetical protein